MDTMHFTPRSFYDEALRIGHSMAFQPEGGGTVASMDWETMSTCHCKFKPLQMTVDRWKFLDSRRMTSVRDRWSTDHTDAFQTAYFSGVGYEVTENDWGELNTLTARNAEALRRINKVMRYLARGGLLLSPTWRPHPPGVLQMRKGVFAASYPHPTLPTEEAWLFVNRDQDAAARGAQFRLPVAARAQLLAGDAKLYDCWSGVAIPPAADGTVSFEL